ncbi:hypothetical protein [Sorangium sp. So ce854]|uniref:hypothetical protein n=1 Tax=Sorangium sp. So ce854 TaxID=3133322 RepID=UPI003F5E25D1
MDRYTLNETPNDHAYAEESWGPRGVATQSVLRWWRGARISVHSALARSALDG